MGSVNDKYGIKCWNDCLQSGCPGHEVKIQANNTSNALAYYKDGEIKFGMDFDDKHEEIYGYVTEETLEDNSTTIYTQTIDELNLPIVIKAVNGLI